MLAKLSTNYCIDRLVKLHMTDRLPITMHCVGNFHALELAITSDELSFRDFDKVVIFGSDPKHRHGFGLSLLQAAGEFYGRERFVNRVEWTSKQTRLLAGNNCDAIRFAQQLDVLACRFTCAPTLVHRSERVAHTVSIDTISFKYFGHALL